MSLPVLFEEVLVRGSIRKADVVRLEALLAGTDGLDRSLIELLLSVHEACPIQDPAWRQFLIPTVTDYLVDREPPCGYLTMEQTDWLLALVRHDGAVESRAEIDLLLSALMRARWAPVSLARFLLKQVLRAVAEGTGPLRGGMACTPGTITPQEINLVGRILTAYGGERALPITREEADVLIDIALALDRNEQANAAWQALFDKAITNAILAASGYRVPARAEALGLDADTHDTGLTPESLAQRAVSLELPTILRAYRELSAEEQAMTRLEWQRFAIITAEPVTEVEAHWLARRLLANGPLRRADAALLRCLGAMAVRLHPDLHPLMAEAAAAA
jgi:hypothetical protein